MSPVHVGEVRTEMDAQGDAAGGGAAGSGAAGSGSAGGAAREMQGWAARDRHARLCESMERMKARTDGRGFDA